MTATRVRSDVSVALSVWRALFLREATARLASDRAGALWLFLEPAAHLVFLMVLYGAIRHHLASGAANAEVFVLLGVWGFFLVRNGASRGMDAISANAALFAYRQVRPVDTVIVRAALEGSLYLIVWFLLLGGLALVGVDVVPADPMQVMAAAFLLWFLGMGMALVFSVLASLLPEAGRIIRLTFMPLYILSAVMYPISGVPRAMREWMLLNPIVHGLELMRGGYFASYHGESHVSFGYLGTSALVLLFLGLALHTRYSQRLVAQ
ncbi:ABC transporter permease [Cupriavidus sp. AU9028]|uniref:ABC transporter permease n=1 Tax=Cupriavidus sp. AU9028 TaxID=2871157 RepID=UPI001C945559|nr:ABC transporter permease [Cupriavidus sp. AU9028]MBY4895864.1 ABC transporter permease [Cupriavidus sp. AU9028]